MIKEKRYMGDGVYIEYDGFNYILTASNGFVETDRIVLEPETLKSIDFFRVCTSADKEINKRI